MSVNNTPDDPPDGRACPNCGALNYVGELFVTDAHGPPEYACRGCVAVFLAHGEWPDSKPQAGEMVIT